MKKGLKYIILFLIVPFLMMVMIGFSGVKRSHRKANDVAVEITTHDGHYFTDRLEVLNLLNGENTDYVLGTSLGKLDLKMLE